MLALADDGAIPAALKLRAKFPAGPAGDHPPARASGPSAPGGCTTSCRSTRWTRSRAAAAAHQIRELKGFGPKAEESILAAVAVARADAAAGENGGGRRTVLNRALAVGEQLVAALRAHPASERVELAGSARRMTDSVKDLDVIATAHDPLALAQAAAALELVETAQTPGEAGVRLRTHSGLKVDLRIVAPDQFGNLMQHFTGSKEHNMALREAAVRKGLHVSEYGVLDDATGETHRCEREEEVYALLGMQYIEPELRENRGELEAAAARTLPDADHRRRPPRGPALPHDRVGRHRLDRGDGARRAGRRLRVPGDHRSLGVGRRPHRGLAAAMTADRADPRAVGDRRGRRDPAAGRLGGQHPPRRRGSTTTTRCWPSSTGSSASVHSSFQMDAAAMTARIVARDREPAGRRDRPPLGAQDRAAGRPYAFDFAAVVEAALAARHDARDQLQPQPPRHERRPRARRPRGPGSRS